MNMHSIDFHAHHSPLGAYATFTCGRFAAGGGPTIEGAAPASHDLIVGYIDECDEVHALPFFRDADAPELTEFAIAPNEPKQKRRHALKDATRRYERASDCWSTSEFSFSIFTPVCAIPDPESASDSELQAALLPAICARLTLDNRSGKAAKRLLFAVGADTPCRPIEGLSHAVGWGREIGFAARSAAGLVAWVEWSDLDFVARGRSHLLGRACGFTLEVPAGETRELELVIGFCRTGIVTTGLDCRYLYTRFYSNIEQVLSAALARYPELVARSAELDRSLNQSALDENQRFLFAHAERSYWGNTQLLEHEGKPLWVVLEGEYAMMNTFDLTVDLCFYELCSNPWTVKNVLDAFVERYSYTDELARPPQDAKRLAGHSVDPHDLARFVAPPAERGLAGGLSFTHDMGVAGNFTPKGYSSYEQPGLIGCFSYMTAEQLLNWVLTAVSYVTRSNDEAWLYARAPIFRACLASIEQRDDPDPARRNGLVNLDSSRCAGGWEITTYDSLDPSLGQARQNLYLASKGFATWLGLERVFARLGESELRVRSRAGAERAAHSITSAWRDELGFIPALLGGESKSAILPAIEGLVFPLFWGELDSVRSDPAFAPLFERLERHLRRALSPDLCLFGDGGWKLSSTADNSWLSKIFLCQAVAERVFGVRPSPESHSAHARWQQIGSRDTAMSDQCVAGVAQGSKYYPRGVTAMLWLI
ncbi:MAG TPA: glycoside hydrolase family 52 protein [Polyangiaceae bacterium]|jgi:hypothetical protein